MTSNRIDVKALERQRRRSRRYGRLTLYFFLLLVPMIFILLVLFRSSTYSHDEVRSIIRAFPGRLATSEEAQRVLGRPLNTQLSGGNDKNWRHHMQCPEDMVRQFTRSELNQVDVLVIIGMPDGKGNLGFSKRLSLDSMDGMHENGAGLN
jgi:hypothetical protein